MDALAESLKELATNEAQWQAFQVDGHCVVLAPPGSGKTKLLTTRLAYDLGTTIRRPHGAACITLTNAAANELETRLAGLGVDWRSTLFVGTVHSFALSRIVIPFAEVCGYAELSEPQLASDRQYREALDTAIDEIYPSSDRRYIDSSVKRLRKMMSEEEWARAGSLIIRVNQRFEEILYGAGVIDFDGIVMRAVSFVEDHAFVRETLAARYPAFFVDEYQDLAPGIDRLVKALCFDHPSTARLFAVGDPHQAIYGWTGSRPELLEELGQRPGVTVVKLNTNYRCGEEIIRVSSRALGQEREVRGVRAGGSVTAHYVPDGFDSQLEMARNLIDQHTTEGTSVDEIAVLCQSNAECLHLAQYLRNAGLPVFVRNNDQYGITPATMLIEALASWAVLPRGKSGYRLGALLRSWRKYVRDADVALVSHLLDAGQTADDLASAFIEGLDELGFGEALAKSSRVDDRIQIERMRRSLNVMSLAELADQARALGRTYITTMTASKGLEFDVVLMLGVEDGKIPFAFSTGAELEEDRRKFYVSLTRARHSVRILYSGWFRWPSGSVNRDGPSRFLLELGLA